MITLITDASYGGVNCAGWAAWYKGDGGIGPAFVSGSVLRFPCATAGDAELAAVFLGYEALGQLRAGHRVMIQSDCDRALRMLRWRYGFADAPHGDGRRVINAPLHQITSQEQRILDAWEGMENRPNRLDVLVRHVKGHTRKSQLGRYWVNRRCDELARGHMNQQRRNCDAAGKDHVNV